MRIKILRAHNMRAQNVSRGNVWVEMWVLKKIRWKMLKTENGKFKNVKKYIYVSYKCECKKYEGKKSKNWKCECKTSE